MYSTCIFCHTALGTNEAIEHFPVGRRLAFDAAKGRLWVVCKSCERWNLTPLEERWEAIEECEGLFSDARLRVSTEHVGLAKLREGLTLIRIGAPKRPELAAWRYGDQFGRRRRRHIAAGAAFAVTAAGLVLAGPLIGGVFGAASVHLLNIVNVGNILRGQRIAVRMTVDGDQTRITKNAVLAVGIRPNAEHGFELEVAMHAPVRPFRRPVAKQQWLRFTGDDALNAARIFLPQINAGGGSQKVVAGALDILEMNPDPARLFTELARSSEKTKPALKRSVLPEDRVVTDLRRRAADRLGRLPVEQRLAMEMALHENDERLALEGELAALEARWKEAEEIAAISDDLFVATSVTDRVRSIKERR